jgi:hypothetical protein
MMIGSKVMPTFVKKIVSIFCDLDLGPINVWYAMCSTR